MNSQEPGGGQAPSYQPAFVTPPAAKKSKKPLLFGIIGGVVALVVIAALLVYFLVLRHVPLKARHDAPKLLPADTAAFTTLSVDLGDVEGFKHLQDVFGDTPQVNDVLDQLKGALQDQFGVTFEEDIQPWLGSEVALSIGNIEALGGGEEPDVTVLVATKNRKASDAFLDKVRRDLEERGSYQVVEETYQNVSYFAAQPESEYDTPYFFGTVRGFVALTSGEPTMKDLIDAQGGKMATLAGDEGYKRLVGALPGSATGYLYLDVGALMNQLAAGAEEEMGLTANALDQIKAYEAMGMALNLDKEGLQLDLAVTFDPEKMPEGALGTGATKTNPGQILGWIAEDALGFMSAQDLDSVWKGVYEALAQAPDFEQQLNDISNKLGVRIDKELLSWQTGEFAIAVYEARDKELLPVMGFLVAEVSDQPKAEGFFEDIVTALEETGGVTFETQDYSGVEMQVFVEPSSEETIVGYGFRDQHLLLGVLGEGLQLATEQKPKPITGDQVFKAVRSHLPGRNTGYFYVNMGRIMDVVKASMDSYARQDYEDTAAPLLDPIKAIGLAAAATDLNKGTSAVRLFVYIP